MVLGFRIGFRLGSGYGLGSELGRLRLGRSRECTMIMRILTKVEVQGSVCMCVCEGCRSNCIQYCPYLCTQTDICDNQKGLFKMGGHNYAAYVDDKQDIIFIYL